MTCISLKNQTVTAESGNKTYSYLKH